MRGLILRAVAVLLAVLIASQLPFKLVTIREGDWGTLAVFALGVAVINAFIGPILKLISFPITVLTLGLWIFVLNGILFWLATALLPGVSLAGSGLAALGAAIVVAFLISVVSFAVHMVAR
jgi:putative membrane protein